MRTPSKLFDEPTKDGEDRKDTVDAKSKEPELPTLGKFPILQVKGMENYINMLIYAESGVGKTVLCGSAYAVDAMSPVLFIDVEGGTMSLHDFYPGVHVVRIQKWTDMQRLVRELAKGRHGYKTIVIDSLTECSKLSMQDVMDYEVATSARDIDPDVPEIRHWGKNIEQMRRFVRTMRDLEVNVLFTALSDKEKDNKGRWQNYPMMPGKLAKEIPGFMDIVCFYYIKSAKRDGKEVKHRLLATVSTDTAVAKDRSNKLPQVLEDPTMTEIYDTIIGINPAKENK